MRIVLLPARGDTPGPAGRRIPRALHGWPAALLLLSLVGIWELYVDAGNSNRALLLAAPHQIAKSLYTDRSLLWSNLLVTAKEVLLGTLVAAIAGFLLAVVMHFSPTLRRAFYPLVVASQAVPFAILASVLVYWLGFGILPKLVVVALVSFFSIVVTTLDGLASVDPQLLKLMRTFDASRRRTFREVELPSALPGVFTGAKIAVSVAVIAAVFAETSAGSSGGLGYLLQQSIAQLLTARAYAIVVILCVFAVALFALLTLAERLALPWAHQPRGDIHP
jgi:putative hydroxymethylpyrimidine transport system permease protein